MAINTRKIWLLVGGIIFTLLGILLLLNPGKGLIWFVVYLGIAKLTSGIVGIILFLSRDREKEKYSLLISAIDIVFGLLVLSLDFFALLSALYIFTYVVAAWIFLRGLTILFKRRDDKSKNDRNISFGVGIFSIMFAVLFFIYPIALTAIAWISFIYLAGIMFVLLGISYLVEFLFNAPELSENDDEIEYGHRNNLTFNVEISEDEDIIKEKE